MKYPFWFVIVVSLTVVTACSSGTATETETVEQQQPPSTVTEQAVADDNVVIEDDTLRRQTVIFDINGGRVPAPENWNPYAPGARLDQGFHQAMIEPLFILNYETGAILPWLAESYRQNETADVWHITLREGIRWSDGQPLTAADLVFTINLLKDTPTLINAGEIERWVESVTQVDRLTVRFDLTETNPRFILDHFAVKIFGRHNILPQHIWQDKDPLTFNNYDPAKGWPVFTGPYLLERVSETAFVYVRDDDWWGVEAGFLPLPQPERLMWVVTGTEEVRVNMLMDNQLDSLAEISIEALLSLQADNPEVIAYYDELPYAWPDPCARNLELNHEVPPWGNKAMRQALNYAINRDEIVEIAYQGGSTPSRLFFPTYAGLERYVDLVAAAGLYEVYPITTTNVDEARRLIEAQGYTLNAETGFYEQAGEVLSIHIQTPEPLVEKQRQAAVIVAQLERVGIQATYGNVVYSEFWSNFFTGQYEARIGWQTCGSINEPWASMDTFNIKWYKPTGEAIGTVSENGWRWQNGAYSALVDEIGTLPLGDAAIDDLFVEAMAIWLDELPVIPLNQAQKIIPFNNTYWTNWPSAGNPYIHPPTWWQSAHVIIHNLEQVSQ